MATLNATASPDDGVNCTEPMRKCWPWFVVMNIDFVPTISQPAPWTIVANASNSVLAKPASEKDRVMGISDRVGKGEVMVQANAGRQLLIWGVAGVRPPLRMQFPWAMRLPVKRLLELSVFALGCRHGLRFQFFGVAVEADEYSPAGKEESGRAQGAGGKRQLRRVLVHRFE